MKKIKNDFKIGIVRCLFLLKKKSEYNFINKFKQKINFNLNLIAVFIDQFLTVLIVNAVIYISSLPTVKNAYSNLVLCFIDQCITILDYIIFSLPIVTNAMYYVFVVLPLFYFTLSMDVELTEALQSLFLSSTDNTLSNIELENIRNRMLELNKVILEEKIDFSSSIIEEEKSNLKIKNDQNNKSLFTLTKNDVLMLFGFLTIGIIIAMCTTTNGDAPPELSHNITKFICSLF